MILPLPVLHGEGRGEGLLPQVTKTMSAVLPLTRSFGFDLSPHPPSPEGGLRRTRAGEVK